MCHFRDLNKASPKDNFPLPHIDLLVDNTAQHSYYSFMDGFSGYNQIRMAPEDKEETTFITTWGTFCYKVMPFRLKNAGATYQRAMVTLFHDMMHREVEKMEWNQKCQEAFEKVKQYLAEPPILVPIIPDKPLVHGGYVGATRCLRKGASFLLPQQKIHRMQIEVPNTKADLLHFSLGSEKAKAVHASPHQPTPHGSSLKQIPSIYTNQKAIKGSTLSEQLAHHPLNEYHPFRYEFPDEQIMVMEEISVEEESNKWKLWFDGASNLLGNGIGAVLASPKGQYFPFSARLGFDYTTTWPSTRHMPWES
ncbi:hypothetical protein CR513_25266, partial [Mucuna pruriens]